LVLVAVLTGAGVWGQGPAKEFREIGSHANGVASVHYSPDGKWLASGGGDKIVRVWEINSGKKLREFKGPSSYTLSVRFSPNGKILAAAGYESSGATHPIYLYDLTTGKDLGKLAGHGQGIRRVVYTPDGKQLVSGGFDGTVRVWDLATLKEVQKLAFPGAVYSIALTPDGKTLAGGGPNALRVWDLPSGKDVTKPTMTKQSGQAVAFSADGKLLASGSNSAIKIWKVATGRELHSLAAPMQELSFLIFSTDGRTLYSSSYDHKVRAWEVRTAKVIHEFTGHTNWVWGIGLAPDDRSVASCSYDGKLFFWDLSKLARPAAKAVKLMAGELESYWTDLGNGDPGKGFKAVWALTGDPAQSLPFVRKRLEGAKPPGALTAAEITRLIADLDANEFAVREKASAALEKAGAQVIEPLKRVLEKPPSLEVKRRATRILRKINPGEMSPEELRVLRGVQVLESIGTPQARKVLETFARGAPGLRLTEEAALAVARLARPRTVRP
jgi:hypothetical protein